MGEIVQIQQQGRVTLPIRLRTKYGIEARDTFYLVDLDGTFVLTPMVPMVPELVREIDQLRQEAGITTEDLLTGLRDQRERYYRENYADDVEES